MTTPRVAAVVLAAGGSSRLGHAKQLVEHDGESLVARAARAALGTGASPVIVVVGAGATLVRAALRDVPVTVVTNDRWQDGLASSLAAGVRAALGSDVDGVLVTLADQPLVDSAALLRLVTAWPAGGIAASHYGATSTDSAVGAPALFARAHAESLVALTGDAGAGRWLRARAATVGDVVAVPMDAAVLDVDTPADVARLRSIPRAARRPE